MSLSNLNAPNPAALRDLTTKAPAREIVRTFLHQLLNGTRSALDVLTAAAAAASAAATAADGKATAGKVRYENGLIGAWMDAATVADLTALRATLAAAVTDLATAAYRINYGPVDAPTIMQATQNGKLKLNNPCGFRFNGSLINKPNTDDLWVLSSLGTLAGGQYLAAYLYLDGTGAASVVAGTIQATENAAIGALPAIDPTKAVIGVAVGQPNCNFANALTIPAAVKVYGGFPSGFTPTAAAPAALTVAAPGSSILAQGGTAGRIATKADLEFRILGRRYRKAAADNVFNLSALGTTDGTTYKAVALYLDASGTGSVAAGAGASSSAAAIAALPAADTTKALIGVFVMNPSGNFANALTAQGSYVDGWPATAF